MAAATSSEVRSLSSRTVRPAPRPSDGEHPRSIHLTVWDLELLPLDYIQKCILLPPPPSDGAVIPRLFSSFSQALDLFFPLAGRLATTDHDDDAYPPSLSISLSCTDQGAVFIHASAPNTTLSDILTPLHTPAVVSAIFPLNGATCHDGHTSPLFAVQVTELADGAISIAGSLNHSVGDGTTFWRFLNAWSEISRTGATKQLPSVNDRWFPDSIQPPIRLPSTVRRRFAQRTVYPPVKECFFNFSAESIAGLKAKANLEMAAGGRISSLQSLLAHVWRAVIRARGGGARPDQETAYFLAVGYRSRVNPPLPETYLGTAVSVIPVRSTAGEVVGRGLGWAAWLLNRAVASQTEEEVHRMLEAWARSPSYEKVGSFGELDLVTGSSPRFDVFGNDFGWGRPVAVRSGRGNKFDGKVTVFPGMEGGSMGLEFCLSPEAMTALVGDEEFMEVVSK